MPTYKPKCIYSYMYACMHTCIHNFHACLPIYISTCKEHIYMKALSHTCMCPYIQTHACLSTYIHTSSHAYTDVCLTTYIHICLCLQTFIVSELSISTCLDFLVFANFQITGNMEILKFKFGNCAILYNSLLVTTFTLAKSAPVIWIYFFCHFSKTTTFGIISETCIFNDEA